MRTLVISDLHLGQRPGHDLLRVPAVLAALLEALGSVDRLILLGDVVELGSRLHRRRPMQTAAPVLREIGARMGPEREIVVVPGNHDGALVRDWIRTRGNALGLDDAVAPNATPILAALTALLGPARVRVSYPGVWVRDDVWATHGHYLDRHLLPESTFGVPRARLSHPGSPTSPSGYESARRRRAARRRERHRTSSQLRERPLATVIEQLAELTRHTTQLLRSAHLTSLTAGALDLQARHAAVPALAHVCGRLGVGAPWVIFGHIHRAGPDAGRRWAPWPDAPQLLNTGSWVYEPLLLEHGAPPHPYWPGGAIRVAETGDPEVLHLLDGFSAADLRPPRRVGGE